MAPTEDLARNPGMCPDWELNLRPFAFQPMLNPLSYISQGRNYSLYTTNLILGKSENTSSVFNKLFYN